MYICIVLTQCLCFLSTSISVMKTSVASKTTTIALIHEMRKTISNQMYVWEKGVFILYACFAEVEISEKDLFLKLSELVCSWSSEMCK